MPRTHARMGNRRSTLGGPASPSRDPSGAAPRGDGLSDSSNSPAQTPVSTGDPPLVSALRTKSLRSPPVGSVSPAQTGGGLLRQSDRQSIGARPALPAGNRASVGAGRQSVGARGVGHQRQSVGHRPPTTPRLELDTQSVTAPTWPHVGAYIEAQLPDWSRYYGGEVKAINMDGNTFDVLFDDGDRVRDVKRSEIRKPAHLVPGTPLSTGAPELPRYHRGDRVSAKIPGWNQWYDGVVSDANRDALGVTMFTVEFDDGEIVTTVREREMMAIKIDGQTDQPSGFEPRPGMRVEAKVLGWNKWYSGLVEACVDPQLRLYRVMFDDGELREDVHASMMRSGKSATSQFATSVKFVREEDPAALANGLRIGSRVLANPNGEWTKAYPGTIERRGADGTFAILFDDGDRAAGVRVEDITMQTRQAGSLKASGPSAEDDTNIALVPEMLVEAKVDKWRKFYVGRIRCVNPDKTYGVDFLDGEFVPAVRRVEIRLPRGRSDTATSVKSKISTVSATRVGANPADREFLVNSRVAVRLPEWRRYYGGVVVRKNASDGTWKIVFDDGEVYESVSAAYIKIPKPGSKLARPKKGTEQDGTTMNLVAGQRIECKVETWTTWYPGVIEEIAENGNCIIVFDDGSTLHDVLPTEIRPVRQALGDSSDDEDDDSDDEDEAQGDGKRKR